MPLVSRRKTTVDDSGDVNSSTAAAAEPLLDAEETMNDDQLEDYEDDMSHFQQRQNRTTWSFWVAVVVAVLPMFLFGYNTGVLNAPESVIFPGHSTAQWSAAVSAFCVGGFIGANCSGSAADRCGRRTCLLATGHLSIVSGAMHFVAPNMSVLILARTITGVAGGASTVLCPMYLSEISPTEIRGSVGTTVQLACVLGIMASILMAPPFATDSMWRILFVPIPIIGLVLVLVGHFALPESPKWLLLNTSEQVEMTEAARPLGTTEEESTSVIRDNDDEPIGIASTEKEEEIDHAVSENAASLDEFADESLEEHKSFRNFLLNPKNRIPLCSSVLFPVAQQLSGINAVFYYSTFFFQGVIDNPLTGSIIAFAVNVVATVFAILIMDRFGRRTLLSWSAGGMLGCCILLTLALLRILPKTVTLIAVLVYIWFFELGLGCIPFFLSSEMIESEFLGRVQSIAMSANWLSNFLVGMFFPFLSKSLGPYAFVPFSVMLFGTLVFSIVWLPETRGKTQQEVMLELERKQSTRRAQHHALSLVSPDPETTIV